MRNVINFIRPLPSVVTAAAFRLLMLALVFTAAVSCNTQKAAADTTATKSADTRPERGGRPSVDQIFEMDANKDGKLAKSEVKGPLERDFAKIDADSDGFLSRKEVENMPQPQGGQRPPRNQ